MGKIVQIGTKINDVENTEQNKVKFFAQYWGQKVFVNPILTPKPVDKPKD